MISLASLLPWYVINEKMLSIPNPCRHESWPQTHHHYLSSTSIRYSHRKAGLDSLWFTRSLILRSLSDSLSSKWSWQALPTRTMRWRLQQPRDNQTWHLESCSQVEQSLMEAKAVQRPRVTPHWAVGWEQSPASGREVDTTPLETFISSNLLPWPDYLLSSQDFKELKEKSKYSVSEDIMYKQRE